MYKLCYIENNKAWFTKLNLPDQYGDDWNDAPYEHNAGRPYDHRYEGNTSIEDPDQLFILYYDGPLCAPSEGVINSRYSIDDINNKQVPWLTQELWGNEPGPPIMIWAGVSVPEFCSLVERAGGTIYVAVDDHEELMEWIKERYP